MEIRQCTIEDIQDVFGLYQAARDLQTEKKMVVWPIFDRSLIESEIDEGRQWKLVAGDKMVCNWAVTFEDKEIWEDMDKGDAIYIHRIAVHPEWRGNRFIDIIVDWAKAYARSLQKSYVRLDTLGNNVSLIGHYTSAGFNHLGVFRLSNVKSLPAHYQREPACQLFEMYVG